LRFATRLIALLLILTAAACATQPPQYRDEAIATLERLKLEGGERLRPAEYASAYQAFLKGDSLILSEEYREADRYFEMTLLKGELLERAVQQETERQQAEARRLAEEKRKAELELRAKNEAERLARARAEAAARKEAVEVERRKAKPQKEPPQVNSYTVKRGESLPLIASHPQVFGDSALWPLIYRANRAQIRDPRHLWPGQVLRIPRNLGRDDMAEARRYAQERPLH